jgi:1-acyl-sn-glycerol-3-phosphate acyltransferase
MPVFILKKSLFRIPLIGLFCRSLEMIGIDRNSYSKQHKIKIITKTNKALAAKRNIVIFPQGTRVPSNETYNYEKYPYKAGITIFAPENKVITASTNARQFFGKSLFSFKKAGVIHIKFNDVLHFQKDAQKDEIITKVRNSIEKGCKQIDSL